MDETFVKELVELRNALKEIKANAKVFITQSDSATKSLQKLNKKLAALRALKPYKES